MAKSIAVMVAAAATGVGAFAPGFGTMPGLRVRGMASALAMSQGDKCFQTANLEVSRRTAGLLLSGAAWQLSTLPASALSFQTIERVAKDPSLLRDAFDKEKTDAAVKKWKRATNMVKNVDAADAASYTLEYEEFKQAVGKVNKLKIGNEIVENPSEEVLLKAWKEEEVKRALAREAKGEEPLTRPVKGSDGAVSYLPPVVTKPSSPEALALAKHLKDMGATMCSHCYGQKQVLGQEATEEYLTYVECDKKGANSKRDMCKEKKVPGFPTWEINGEFFPGEKSLEDLAKLAKFDLKAVKL